MLERHQAPATFFMTGRAVSAHPEWARAVVEAGQAVGNHSWSHPRFVLQGPRSARQELDSTEVVLREAGVVGEIPFRSPYGKKGLGLQWALWRSGRVNVLFDVMPTDYMRPGVDEIVAQVMEGLHPGAIVCLHDGGGDRSQTVAAVDELIPMLRAEGYRLVRWDHAH